ncbi:uncharacterized protein LOC142357304 isoform X2 [Convolutriloba macropyga]|uniref:uncharacterized protein LOC142357304 isoform X2 n=1 Tax=Convolutriloba macropyga TaxID=536237 RepID=UPI003F527043
MWSIFTQNNLLVLLECCYVDSSVAEKNIRLRGEKRETLLFWISTRLTEPGRKCRQLSQYYCLNAYFTAEPDPGKLVRSEDSIYDVEASKLWFAILIKDKWRKINMMNENNPKECCGMQVLKYSVLGLRNRQMSPDEYMAKLSNYSNEDDKPLNHSGPILALYLLKRCHRGRFWAWNVESR